MSFKLVLDVAERLFILIGGFFVGLMVADLMAGEDVWLLKWSTLIAGTLAVFAAILTFGGMLHVDQKQGNRHTQLMELTLAQARRKVMRLEASVEALNEFADRIDEIIKLVANTKVMDADRQQRIHKQIKELAELVDQFDGMPQIPDAYEFFGSDAAIEYEITKFICKKIRTFPQEFGSERSVWLEQEDVKQMRTFALSLQKLINEYQRA